MTEKDVVAALVRGLTFELEIVAVDVKDRAFLVRTTGKPKEEYMVGVQKVKT